MACTAQFPHAHSRRSRRSASCSKALAAAHPCLPSSRGCSSAIPCVCKRWRDVFHAEPGLWHTFAMPLSKLAWRGTLLPECREWMDRRLVLLRRVAHHVAAFTWDASGTRQLYQTKPLHDWFPGYFAALQPEGMTALRLCDVDRPPEGLARFHKLTALEITSSSLAPEAVLAIGRMHQLVKLGLRIHPNCSSDGVVASVLQLTGLTSLELSLSSPLPAAAAHMTRLAQLRHLSVTEQVWHGQPVVQPLLPTQFPAGLLSSHYMRSPAPFQARRMMERPCAVHHPKGPCCSERPPGTAATWHLTSQHVPALFSSPAQVAGARLRCYRYQLEVLRGSQTGAGELMLTGVRALPSLQLLLEALLPAGAPLARLELRQESGLLRQGDGEVLDIAALRACPRLASLRELQLAELAPGGGGSEAALEALLQHATQLADLELKASHAHVLTSIPPCLAAQTGLTRLALASHNLTTLPHGPYLAGAPCCRSRLHCCRLRRCCRRPTCAVICSHCACQADHWMPRTCLLCSAALPAACLPAGLRRLDLSHNNFRRLPSALRAASSLTSLALSGRQLELTAADVDSTLAQLTQLRELQGFGQAGHPWALLPHLQQCMPQLKADFGKEPEAGGGDCGCPKCRLAHWGYDSSSSSSSSDDGDGDYW